MNSIDQRDNLGPYKCQIKLRFAKRTEGRTSSAEPNFVRDEVDIGPRGCEQSNRNEGTVISKQSIRRRKNDMKCSHPKGILKIPQLSRGLPHLSNTCTSSQSYSECRCILTETDAWHWMSCNKAHERVEIHTQDTKSKQQLHSCLGSKQNKTRVTFELYIHDITVLPK